MLFRIAAANPARSALAVVSALAVFLASARADADVSPKTRAIWIETRPWTCAHEASAFAREIELACDAAGRCRVSPTEADATHRAVLICESTERWILRAESGGRTEFTLALTGEREERLRKAAMWMARTEDDSESLEDRPAQVPAVVKPSRTTVTVTRAPEAHREADAASKEEAEKGDKSPKKRSGLDLSVTFGIANARYADSYRGLHGALLFDVGPVRIGPAASVNQMFRDGSAGTAGERFHAADIQTAGARVGIGAPFTDAVVGVWAEGGILWGERSSTEAAPGLEIMNPFARAEVVLQAPFDFPVRPYIYGGGMQTFGRLEESMQSAMAGAGLAWRAW
jgi:hypothetical protein